MPKKPLNPATAEAGDIKGRVEDIRRQIAELTQASRDLENAPLTPAEAGANIDRLIEHQAARFLDTSGRYLAALARPGVEPESIDLIREVIHLHGGAAVAGFMAHFFPDQVRAALEKQVLPHADPNAPTLPARAARQAEIAGEILQLEIREEALIVQAEQAGIDIDRRADLDPRAFFEEAA